HRRLRSLRAAPPQHRGIPRRRHQASCSHYEHERGRVTYCFLSGVPLAQGSAKRLQLSALPCERSYTCTVPYKSLFAFYFCCRPEWAPNVPRNGTLSSLACSLLLEMQPGVHVATY